jgi:hypothetical protein
VATCYYCFKEISDKDVMLDHDCIPFCSKSCADKTYGQVNNVSLRICKFCGNKIGKTPIVALEWPQHTFCSWGCVDLYGRDKK